MRGRADDAGPNDPVHAPSDLVDAVLGLLEDAIVPVAVCDLIVRIIEEWEKTQAE